MEQAIDREEKTFNAEEAHEYIQNLQTEDLALVPCPCRTRTEKMDIRECRDRFPVGSCIFIANTATKFIELGLGKRVTKEQAIAYLDEMVELGLIPTVSCASVAAAAAPMFGVGRAGTIRRLYCLPIFCLRQTMTVFNVGSVWTGACWMPCPWMTMQRGPSWIQKSVLVAVSASWGVRKKP